MSKFHPFSPVEAPEPEAIRARRLCRPNGQRSLGRVDPIRSNAGISNTMRKCGIPRPSDLAAGSGLNLVLASGNRAMEEIGKAVLADFELLGIMSVGELATKDADALYVHLCEITRERATPVRMTFSRPRFIRRKPAKP